MANIDGSMHLTSNLTAEFGAGSIVANPYHITVTDIEGGHRLTVTRGNETQTMNVMDGVDGDPGYSPTITISEIEGGHTVVIVDHAGAHQFNVMDGVQGLTGNGIANTVLNDDYTLTITYTNGSSYTTPSIRGEKGDEGTTDHTHLINRDAADQHLMSSITGLGDALDKKVDKGYYRSISKQKDYLYVVNYDDIDYDYAKEHFEGSSEWVFSGACSSVSKGNYYGRNFDWFYDNSAEFIVNVSGYAGRHASHGVASGISALTNTFVESGEESDLYKLVPFVILDGQNDAGLICSTNVVPTDYGENTSVPTVEKRESICGAMLVRYILDKFDDPLTACQYIKQYVSVYFTDSLHEKDYEQHYMIKKGNVVYCLEFVNNVAVYYDISSRPFLTNFLLYNTTINYDWTVFTPYTQTSSQSAMITNGITRNGSGLERWNIIANAYGGIDSVSDMRELLDDLKYTRTYTETNPVDVWYTEMVGFNNLTAGTPYTSFTSTFETARGMYAQRDRSNPETWQSVHSVIYEDSIRTMYVVVQEDGEELKFGFGGADVPTKLSELENDVGYITEDDIPVETDPTVPSWAKQPDKPTYNANEVGAVSANQGVQHSGKIMGVNTDGVVVPVDSPVAGVSSVNGMTGNVTIEAEDIGAYEKPTAGIPANDMASSVQVSLSKADNAATQSALDTEAGARQQADNALQEQIDALVSKSDVVDVVGTYAELQAYDTSTLGNNDVVKVLSDSTHDNARTYYRWVISGSSGSWTYVGGESVGYTKAETDTLLNAKQDAISDLNTIRSGASAGATAYQKPSSGVPKTDLTSAVQDSLGLADTALQEHQSLTAYRTSAEQDVIDAEKYEKPSSGIPESDLAQSVQTSLGLADTALQSFTETDPTVPSWAKAQQKPSYSASEIAYGSTNVGAELSSQSSQIGAKQDAISDLETIRSGASAGATAVQPSTLNSYATQTYVNQQIAAAIADVDDLLGSGVID